MIELTPNKGGVILNVHAHPGARRNGVTGEHAGAIRIAVNAPPDKGKANVAILQVLAEVLELKPSQVSLISGETSRRKRVQLAGLTVDEASRRVEAALVSGERRPDATP